VSGYGVYFYWLYFETGVRFPTSSITEVLEICWFEIFLFDSKRERKQSQYSRKLWRLLLLLLLLLFYYYYYYYYSWALYDRKYGRYKVKVKLSCALTEHHAIKAYWGSGGIAPLIKHARYSIIYHVWKCNKLLGTKNTVKVKLSLCLIKHHATKTYLRVEV
jgi:hypothetical protein